MKYKVTTIGKVTISEEGSFGQDGPGVCDTEAINYIAKINEAISASYEDLAQYISATYERDALIHGTVKSIGTPVARNVGGARFALDWEVETDSELNDKQQEALLDYITGQCSDGWGEGFEQQPIEEWNEERGDVCSACNGTGEYEEDVCEYCDGRGDEYYDVKIGAYAHPWFYSPTREDNDGLDPVIEKVA